MLYCTEYLLEDKIDYAYIESEPAGDPAALKLFKFMKGNILTIRRLVDCAEQLAKKIQRLPSEFVMCHSDIHAGNILLPLELPIEN
jgi:spectinomycin phosphotransferase